MLTTCTQSSFFLTKVDFLVFYQTSSSPSVGFLVLLASWSF